MKNIGPIRWASGIALSVVLAAGCSDDPTGEDPETPLAGDECVADALALQNARAFTLGETFYLPRVLDDEGCPDAAGWEVMSAPAGSQNAVYNDGAPEPRFTPDVAGSYVFHVPALQGVETTLTVVERSVKDRFRNHYLTPLYGAALVGDGLWTANGASYTVTRLSRSGGRFTKLSDVTVGSWPAAIAWRDPLPYGVIALRGSDTVGFIDRDRGALEDALWVGDEPTGLAISPDASQLYVSLATMREVAVVDLATRAVIDRISVGFDPRAVIVSDDGARLFVASYRSGNRDKDVLGNYGDDDDRDVWIIDLQTRETVDIVDGVSADLRAMALSEDGSELFIAATDVDPIPAQSEPGAAPFVHEIVVIGADPAQAGFGEISRRVDLTRQASSQGPVVNPAGVVVSGDTVWVASESSDLVVALDRQTLAEQTRIEVGPGARQLVALDDGSVAVHCYQSFELWTISGDGQIATPVALTADARPAEVALGERVFTRPGAEYAANHACSSCHVESQNDGIVWRFGPELWHNVRPLQLLDATTPIEWGAYISSTANFGYAGPASIVNRPVTPEQAIGLERFLGSLIGAPRATGRTRLDGSYTEAALRGKALFEGKAVCSACHVAPLYTSRQLLAEGKSGEPADVPTLLGVYRHGVYMVAGQARRLEDAADVAIEYVGVTLTADERSDLIEFLYQLTPKGSAPLAIWPDIDSNDAVYPGVKPFVKFAGPVDDSAGRSAAAAAADFVILEDFRGDRVPSTIEIVGNQVTLVPDAPLTAGQQYRFRVLEGLPFQDGGKLVGERQTAFTVAMPEAAALPPAMAMTVTVGGPMGPSQLPLLLDEIRDGEQGISLVIKPLVFGSQQRQPVWARLDGDRFLMQPFGLPLPPGSVANAADVIGTIVETDGNQTAVRIQGTLRLGGPGIDIPGVPFELTLPGPPPGP